MVLEADSSTQEGDGLKVEASLVSTTQQVLEQPRLQE